MVWKLKSRLIDPHDFSRIYNQAKIREIKRIPMEKLHSRTIRKFCRKHPVNNNHTSKVQTRNYKWWKKFDWLHNFFFGIKGKGNNWQVCYKWERKVLVSRNDRTCIRRLGRRRWSIPVDATGEARCCKPADCNHRAMTASPASLAGPALCKDPLPAWSYKAVAAALLCCIWPPMWRCERRWGANFQDLFIHASNTKKYWQHKS